MKGIKTGGRQKGSLNKITADVRVLARQYTAGAMAELDKLAKKADSDMIRLAAIRELLDRGYGRTVPMSQEPQEASDAPRPPIYLEPFRNSDANERSVEGPIRLGDFRQSS